MKKTYTSPICSIDQFDWEDILCTSALGEGDGAIDTMDDESLNITPGM